MHVERGKRARRIFPIYYAHVFSLSQAPRRDSGCLYASTRYSCMSQATYDAVICIHVLQMSNLDVLQDPYPAVEFHRLLLQFSLGVQRSCSQSMERLLSRELRLEITLQANSLSDKLCLLACAKSCGRELKRMEPYD